MTMQNEHDDDLESEVIEGAEIETETFGNAGDVEDPERGSEPTDQSGRPKGPATEIDEEENEGEARDTI
jgi:hypothetical protein